MIHLLIFLLILVLPFLVLPFGSSFFETPKVIVGEVLIELLLILSLTKIKLKTNLKIIILGLALLSLISFVVFKFPENFFWGNSYRLQGMFLFWHLLVILVISNIVYFKIPKILYTLILSLLALETVLMGQNLSGRFIGPLGEPNSLAATALFFLSFTLVKDKVIFKIIPLAAAIFIIYLSGSKSGLLGLGLILLNIFLVGSLHFSIFKSAIISLVVLILSLSLPFVEGGGWFENRSEIWQTAFFAGSYSPIFGNGFGNIQNSLHQTSIILNNNVQYQIIDSSHNILLDFWIQGGLIGLGLFVFLLWLFFKNIKSVALLGAFLAVFTVAIFNPVSVVNLIELWWILGQSFHHIND